MSKMFPFVTQTWNPLAIRKCSFDCIYCWAEGLKATRLKNAERYVVMNQNKINSCIPAQEMEKKFKGEDFVFVGTMGDMFAPDIPSELINKILGEQCRFYIETQFLFLTKNPGRYAEFLNLFLKFKATLGATIETNRDTSKYSKAPNVRDRFYDFMDLEYSPKFLSIEPIMDFDLQEFSDAIRAIPHLTKIAVGYDNYNHGLPEPPLEKTLVLIHRLRSWGYEVIEKTLREAQTVAGENTNV